MSGEHHRPVRGKTDEWLTPPEILKALGPFDLDPCAPEVRPWDTAKTHYTKEADGLVLPWKGRVFLNPPYGPEARKWLRKLSLHGDGIALIFARTETDAFFRYGWNRAHAMLFLRGRLHFYDVQGGRARHNAGAPSVLIAYGVLNAAMLAACGIPGQFIALRRL